MIKKGKNGFTFFVIKMGKKRILAIYAIIKKRDKFLMAKRKDGSVGLVGGRLEKGETLLQGIKRELREEVNLEPKKIVLTPAIQEFKSRRMKGIEKHHFFFVELSDEEIPRDGEENVLWVDEKEIVKSIFPDREKVKKKILELYKEGKSFSKPF